MDKKIRILLAKPGLDGHEAGAKVVARALRDEGMEVIYTGPRQTPEMIVESALQEGVDLVGLSILSGAHVELCARIKKLLEERGLRDLPLIVGGIIPKEDVPVLKKIGVREVFGPGSDTQKIAKSIQRLLEGL